MKAPDLIELASRNLRESLLRNSLTTLGIGVGVASLVAMLSLGVGLQQMANRRLAKAGLFDTIIVTSRRDFRGYGREEQRNGPAPAQSSPLDETARAKMENIPGVIEATPDVRFMTDLRFGGKTHLGMVAALPASAKERDAFDNISGTFFTSMGAPEAILRKQFADELLGIRESFQDGEQGSGQSLRNDPTRSLIGKELDLRYAERVSSEKPIAATAASKGPAASGGGSAIDEEASDFADLAGFSVVPHEAKIRIVGIIDQDPDSMRGQQGGRVFIPLQYAEGLHVMLPSELRENTRSLSNDPTYGNLSVRVGNPNHIEVVENAIKRMGFNTFSILDATRSLRRFFAVLDLFLGIFGSLALAVASLGIVNTLVMAILERRREIGVMKAIGASDADVKRLFFVEAGAMGALGGALGVMLGWGIGRVINVGTNIYLHRQDLPSENVWSVPWWLVAGAITFAILVSMLSGLYPAARAARLDPVEALRYE